MVKKKGAGPVRGDTSGQEERRRTRPRRHEWSRRLAQDPSEETRVVMEIGAGPSKERRVVKEIKEPMERQGPVRRDRSGQGIYGTIEH